MSFNIDATGTPSELPDLLETKIKDTVANTPPEVRDETEHLLSLSLEQVKSSVRFFATNHPSADAVKLRVLLSGHATPDHAPHAESAPEFVQPGVYVLG